MSGGRAAENDAIERKSLEALFHIMERVPHYVPELALRFKMLDGSEFDNNDGTNDWAYIGNGGVIYKHDNPTARASRGSDEPALGKWDYADKGVYWNAHIKKFALLGNGNKNVSVSSSTDKERFYITAAMTADGSSSCEYHIKTEQRPGDDYARFCGGVGCVIVEKRKAADINAVLLNLEKMYVIPGREAEFHVIEERRIREMDEQYQLEQENARKYEHYIQILQAHCSSDQERAQLAEALQELRNVPIAERRNHPIFQNIIRRLYPRPNDPRNYWQ
jgi:hypothetical protein